MATLKQRLHKRNASGGYDVLHLETSASAVLMSDGTTAEATINNKAASVHASQHATGGSDPITPAQIGAVATNLGYPDDMTDLLAWCEKQSVGCQFCVNKTVTNVPFATFWIGSLVVGASEFRSVRLVGALGSDYYENIRTFNGSEWKWLGWNKLATTDYAVNKAGDTMTGPLYINQDDADSHTAIFDNVHDAILEKRLGENRAHVVANADHKSLWFNISTDNGATFTCSEVLHTGNKNLIAPADIKAIGTYSRSDIGTSPNFDDPGVNGLLEVRSSSETAGETGTKPFNSFGPMLNIKTPDNLAMLQIAGTSGTGYYIRGNHSANVTMANTPWKRIWCQGDQITGAVWNDYAEYRETQESFIRPGHCVIENGDGSLRLSSERLQPGGNIVSDTFGFAIGETDQCKTPLAVAGRVLAYPLEDRDTYEPGDAVCTGPNGTVSKMSDEEIMRYPHRIVGTVSEIPQYDIWGTGKVSVDGRIWIKIK